jgi:hypothetical protein
MKHLLPKRGVIPALLVVAYVIVVVSMLWAADPVAIKHQGPDTIGNPLGVALNPAGAGGTFQTAVTSSANAAAGATNASLAGVTGKTTYITGFTVTGGGATAAGAVTVTVTNTVSGTLNYTILVPAGIGTQVNPLVVTFPMPIPANAANTAINVNVPSFGSGSVGQSTSAYGFQM